jgi:hypothetical protein
MEITKGHIEKFDVAEIILKPPLCAGDILDMEVLLLSHSVPGHIKVYLTVDAYDRYVPRVYMLKKSADNVTISSSAKREVRKSINELAMQLRGELINERG